MVPNQSDRPAFSWRPTCRQKSVMSRHRDARAEVDAVEACHLVRGTGAVPSGPWVRRVEARPWPNLPEEASTVPETRHTKQSVGVDVALDCPCSSGPATKSTCPLIDLWTAAPPDPGATWRRTGDTIETLTLRPSVLRLSDCRWHGFVTNAKLSPADHSNTAIVAEVAHHRLANHLRVGGRAWPPAPASRRASRAQRE